MKKLFLLFVAVLSIGLCASAQTRTVNGIVVDANTEEPLIGASVVAAGEQQGVSTDFNGEFSIVVAANATKLTISYVGYETAHVKISSGTLKVQLKPADNILGEVIAVAYGQAKRSEYTGSASVVKADQLEDALVSNVTSALTGKIAGVQTFASNGQPGSGASIQIRGTGSINASSSPLYVVDGVPFSGDITSISNQDIESLVILKDAASTALYGARGANGVILVTTKKGAEGNARITVDARWGSNSRALPSYDMVTNQRQYMELTYQAIANTQRFVYGVNDPSAIANSVNNQIWNRFGGYQTWTIPAGQQAFSPDGKFNPNATPGYSNGRYYWIADDWEKEGLIHGLRQEYNVSISGGTERLQYYLSGTYLEDEGIIKGSHFNRLTTRASVDYQAKKWLKIGTNLSYVYSDQSAPGDQTLSDATSSANVFYFINSMAPVYPVYVRDASGNIMWNKTYNNPIYDYGDGIDYGNGMMNAGRTPNGNPIGGLLYNKEQYLMDIFDGKWYALLTPIKGLTITENVGYHVDNTRISMLQNGLYGQFKDSGGQVLQEQTRLRDITLQTLVNYNFTLADIHNIDLFAAYESEDYASEYVEAIGSNLYQPLVAFVNNTIDDKRGYGAHSELAHRGFLFRGKYTLMDRYYVVGSIRRDGSSRFAPSHRWGTFWALSGGWDIAKEKFMEETCVDLLKFRASFGQNGNDGIGSSTLLIAYQDYYTMTGADGIFSDGTLAYKGNPDITWEKSNNFNVGFDFSFWKGKLSGSIEYYNRQTEDMLFNLPVAASNGYTSIPSNVGSMRNNGVELELNYRPVNTKDITWDIFFNLTHNKNKVLSLDPSILNEDGEWVRSTYSHLYEGGSIYDLYLPVYAGVDKNPYLLDAEGNVQMENEKPVANPTAGYALYYALDADGNEYATPDYATARTTNSKHTGDLSPKVYGGIGTSLKAYGFDFSIACSYQLGGRLIDYGYSYLMTDGSSATAMHKDQLNAWSLTNTNSDIPMLITEGKYNYSTSTSTRFLKSSNYFAINNITFGYTFPTKWVNKLGIDGIRIYGAAENVALFSARKGLDPRQGYMSSEAYTYSPIRAISGGINIKF